MTDVLENLPPLREVIETYDLRAQKALGQNFLLDQNITDKIVRSTGQSMSGVHVVEVGPGPGGLTRSILRTDCADVTAIEFDKRAVCALQGLKSVVKERLSIIEGDALGINIPQIAVAPCSIIANLPYNIATPLLIGWLKDIRLDQSAYVFMALMFQKEVAERICAVPGTKHYGRLSVIAQWLCDVRSVYGLPASAFTPPPKVKSSVVRFIPHGLSESAPSFEAVEKVTEAAFGQRRKMIRSSMKNYLPQIEALGIDPTLRAENLSVSDYINIARRL